MDLGEGTIIQINATVIAGILILLTISGVDPQTQTKSPFLDNLGGVYDAAAIVILPFTASAVVAVVAAYFRESFSETTKLKELREKKIKQLKEQLKSNDEKSKRKTENEIKKLEIKLERANKYLQKYDEEKCYHYHISGRITSLLLMVFGFFYLIAVIYGIAWT